MYRDTRDSAVDLLFWGVTIALLVVLAIGAFVLLTGFGLRVGR